MRTDEVTQRLRQAVARVRHADHHLLAVDVSERCIAARLAMYLREYFVDYDVDVEYNRYGDDVKHLYDLVTTCPRERNGNSQGQCVLPDVVVHRRGSKKSNLLIVEMKKSSNPTGMDHDIQRILAFRQQLGYQVGALLVCDVGNTPDIRVAKVFPEEPIPEDDGPAVVSAAVHSGRARI